MTRGALLTLLTLLSPLALPCAARAQTYVMLPVANDPAVDEASRTAASDAVSAGLAADDGITVLSARDARAQMLAQPFRDCAQVDCAEQVVRAVGASFAAVVTVWPRQGTSAPRSVAVTLVAADGSRAAGESEVHETNVAEAATAALASARQEQRVATQGTLIVRSTDESAEITIDGEAFGRVPVRTRIRSGSHRVVLRGSGAEQSREVTVLADHEAVVDFDAAASPTHPASATTASPLNWVLAGVLALGGGAMLVSPIRTLADNGHCDAATCIHFGARSGALMAGGSALALFGIVVAIVQPLRNSPTVSVAPTTTGASLFVEGRF